MTTNQRILFITSLFLLTASVTYAAGLVPCGGGPPEPMCRVCDFVAMGQGLMTWFIGASATIVALMFAFGGMKMVMSAGNTGKVSEGKEMMSNSIIGFFILLGAWLIVNTILMTVMSDGKGIEVWGTVQCVDNPTMTATMTGPSGGATTNTGPGGMTNPGGGSAGSIAAAALGAQGFSTAGGPGGGSLACAWAVNKVLEDAGISPIDGNSVKSMEQALAGGRGTLVDQSAAKAGDIVIVTDGSRSHTGICMNAGCTKTISNSSSNKTFSWVSDSSFSPSYKAGPGRIYSINKI
ncbi:hypothetical protein IPH92_02055 [Candidatus Kaiserbacteria bacterium]|nr:MAG: hypothetical protein IPH92_02055 [Candidatus Kaiserbacteria bacterium]